MWQLWQFFPINSCTLQFSISKVAAAAAAAAVINQLALLDFIFCVSVGFKIIKNLVSFYLFPLSSHLSELDGVVAVHLLHVG